MYVSLSISVASCPGGSQSARLRPSLVRPDVESSVGTRSNTLRADGPYSVDPGSTGMIQAWKRACDPFLAVDDTS